MAFALHFAKPRFKFSSSHFTVFGPEDAEALHGHNYQVQVRLDFAKTDPHTGIAVDFNIVKASIKALCDQLDEKFLVPSRCPFLTIQKDATNAAITFAKKHYSLPLEDCEFLPLVNISSEQLCLWFCQRLAEGLKTRKVAPQKIDVRIDETQGQGASYEMTL